MPFEGIAANLRSCPRHTAPHIECGTRGGRGAVVRDSSTLLLGHISNESSDASAMEALRVWLVHRGIALNADGEEAPIWLIPIERSELADFRRFDHGSIHCRLSTVPAILDGRDTSDLR